MGPRGHLPRPAHRGGRGVLSPRTGAAGLAHTLGPTLDHLARIPRRRQLLRDPVYRAARPEIDRLLAGFAWRLRPRAPGPRRLRAVAWNIERGKRFEAVAAALRGHPQLAGADLLLLSEVDLGVGRSGNRDVAAQLAAALDLDYVFCNHELLLSPGDAFERDHGLPSAQGLHGSALLTRLPVSRFAAVRLREPLDKFHDLEKRLGGKRALVAEVLLEDGPLTVAVAHLDPFAGPRHRAAQLGAVLRAAEGFGNPRVLLGGDLNTNTYDLSSAPGLALNGLYKLAWVGFERTVAEYLAPERRFERASFEALARAGLAIEGFNQRGVGTTFYDLSEPEMADWTRRYLPAAGRRYLERRLAPWGGRVPLHLAWRAGRGLAPLSAAVVEAPIAGGCPSDHLPIQADFELR